MPALPTYTTHLLLVIYSIEYDLDITCSRLVSLVVNSIGSYSGKLYVLYVV
jgi:hypothetical protein